METLLNAREVGKTFGARTLFTGVSLGINRGDRLGVIGPNGSGKSTLMKILAGIESADEGEITRRRGLRLAYLDQIEAFTAGADVRSVVVEAVENAGHGDDLDPSVRAEIALTKLGFTDLDTAADTLSGGWRKRLAIARATVNEPDVLMLDEPTNHLDMDGVLWLEEFCRRAEMALVLITHDRIFLERVAGRIVELSAAYPEGKLEVKGNYSEFVRRKEQFLEAQANQQQALAGKVRRDSAWLHQGVKGRQTRNKSQVQDTDQRKAQLDSIQKRNAEPDRTTAIDFQGTERQTHKLVVGHHVSKSMGGKPLFADLDFILSSGSRMGLLGPNGSGKTTLLRLITGELEPDTGSVKPAEDLRVVNFTQHREALDPKITLQEALCPVGDTVYYRDKAIHVAGWAKKFLFDTSKFNTPVADLSGGEQARILIANLMLKPADLLILDEPTNDLDIPSLQVLEQALSEFPGAIVLVTHDRFMLQRVSTELLALDGLGHAKAYVDFEQWEANRKKQASDKPAKGKANRGAADPHPAGKPSKSAAKSSGGKLTYKLQRELDSMETNILEAEEEVERLQKQAGDPAVIADHEKHAEVCAKLGEVQRRVDHLYERWAELESMQQA